MRELNKLQLLNVTGGCTVVERIQIEGGTLVVCIETDDEEVDTILVQGSVSPESSTSAAEIGRTLDTILSERFGTAGEVYDWLDNRYDNNTSRILTDLWSLVQRSFSGPGTDPVDENPSNNNPAEGGGSHHRQ